jgi:hypothetical protein
MKIREPIGVARLLDYESGEEIFLTNGETKLFSDLEARIRDVDGGDLYIVQEGSRLALDSGSYLFGGLSMDPQEAMITKIPKEGGRRFSKRLKALRVDDPEGQGSTANKKDSPFAIRSHSLYSKPRS